MTNLRLICAIVFFFGGRLSMAGQNNTANIGSWSGVIINSNCTVDEAFNEAAKCTEPGLPGARLSLYDDTTRQIFLLDPQNQRVRLGDSVTVSGTVQGDTLHVTSLKMLASIGLNVGQKAPAFSARDQFGRQHNLDTLRGPKGTVLLFFRSADW